MAAGLGTRLRPFTGIRPKPLLPILGVPMAQFAIDSLLAASNSPRVVANYHALPEVAREGIQLLDWGGSEVALSDESRLLLGSAGGIRKALPYFKGRPFFVLNADVLFDVDLSELAAAHQRNRERFGAVLTLALLERAPQGRTGEGYREILVEGPQVIGIGSKSLERPFYAGAAVFETEAVSGLPDGEAAEFVPQVLEPAIRAGKAGSWITRGTWYDLGDAAGWHSAHCELIAALESGRIPPPWRARLESVNRRVAPGIWVSKRAPRLLSCTDWAAPAYWDGEADAPLALGPGGILYGLPGRRDSRLEHGVGFGGLWASTESK